MFAYFMDTRAGNGFHFQVLFQSHIGHKTAFSLRLFLRHKKSELPNLKRQNTSLPYHRKTAALPPDSRLVTADSGTRGAGRNDWQATGTVNTDKIPPELTLRPVERVAAGALLSSPVLEACGNTAVSGAGENHFGGLLSLQARDGPGSSVHQGDTEHKARPPNVAIQTPALHLRKKWSVQSSSGTSSAPQKKWSVQSSSDASSAP